jgi:hypothetical protein
MRFSIRSLRRIVPALRRRWSRPPRSLLEGAKSIAFITTNRADRQAKRWSEDAAKFGAAVDVIPTVQPYRRGDGRIMSILAPPPREAYDRVIVGGAVDLFDHSWTYAFLDRLNSLLDERGTILIAPRLISRERLTELFGNAPQARPHDLLAFGKARGGMRRPKDAAHSTLDAYWPLRDTLQRGAFDESLAKTIRALGIEHVEKRKPNSGRDALEQEQSQCYRTTSACTKTPMVRWLAQLHFPERRDLHLADLGCGTGMNTLELMLSPSHVKTLTLVEPHSGYHWDIAAMYERIADHLLGPVSLVGEQVQTYRGRPADIGLVCAVLAVMPRAERDAFAEGAWANIAPGGVLVVLENMRREAAKGDRNNEERYTPDEIDAVLGRFGPIHYFQNDAMAELTRAEAGDRTVFRVIRKAD